MSRAPQIVLALALVPGLLNSTGCTLIGRSGVPEAAAAPLAQTAGESAPRALAQGITVVGNGDARAQPDIALITVGSIQIAPTAQAAMAEVNRRVAGVIAAARGQGLQDRDIQTSGLSLQPIQRPRTSSDQRPPEIEAYRASSNVTLTVRDIAQASAVLDAAMSGGADVVGGVRFTLADPERLRTEALANAVRNAGRNAEEMAKAAGVRLGGVVSLAEEGGATPVPRPATEVARLAAGDVPAPVEPGELVVQARVRATYAVVS